MSEIIKIINHFGGKWPSRKLIEAMFKDNNLPFWIKFNHNEIEKISGFTKNEFDRAVQSIDNDQKEGM